MKGYIIANYNVTDPEKFGQYKEKVFPVVTQFGGKAVVVTPEGKTLEGESGAVMVVVEFESVEAAKTFYESSEYAEIKALRTESTEGWLMIAPGFVGA